jgi:hypothetical protein
MRWAIDAAALRCETEGDAAGCEFTYYDQNAADFKAAYRRAQQRQAELESQMRELSTVPAQRVGTVMWVEPDEDDEVPFVAEPVTPYRRRKQDMLCSSSHCHCGGGSRLQCAWWKARHSAHQDSTDPAVIAQQLWAESRELLAKVNVELPASPPATVSPNRWHRRPIVRRLTAGLVVGTMVAALFAMFAEWSWPLFTGFALTAAFMMYDWVHRIRVPLRAMVARLVAIEFAVLLTLLITRLG